MAAEITVVAPSALTLGVHESNKSHRCEEGGALTPSMDESMGKILCFRVQVHVGPRTNLALWLGDKNTVQQPHYK